MTRRELAQGSIRLERSEKRTGLQRGEQPDVIAAALDRASRSADYSGG